MSVLIGAILRETRKKKHLSVIQVRQLLLNKYNVAVSEKTIYAWENNTVIPSTENFLRICSIYDIKDMSVFIEYESDENIGSLTEEDKYLLWFYHRNKRPRKVIQDITEMPMKLRSV